MDRISSATASFNFSGTLARAFRAAWTWHFWTSVTPIATSTSTFSTLPSKRISKLTPSKNIYLIVSPDRSRVLHFSTASINSLLALLPSEADIFQPISLVEIIDKVRVLIPVKNIKLKSCRSSFSYRLLRGMTWVLNLHLRRVLKSVL